MGGWGGWAGIHYEWGHWDGKKSRCRMYIGIEQWGDRRGALGEDREGDMKRGRGRMRAGGPFGLTWPRNLKMMTWNALSMTRVS